MYLHQQTGKGVSELDIYAWLSADELLALVSIAHGEGLQFLAVVNKDVKLGGQERFSSFFEECHNPVEGFVYLYYWIPKDAKWRKPIEGS